MNPSQLRIADIKAARAELARRSLIYFTQHTNPQYQPAPHHKQIAEALEAVERGELLRLMICMPPRHGKSELASRRFPAWFLGRNPDKQIIAASYNSDLAGDFGREVRNIVAEPEYKEVFSVRLASDSQAANRWHTDEKGMYVAAGVGTAVTGRGAHVLLIDDPFKDREEADSEIRRRRVWDWYTSTAYTRLMKNGAIVVINTRWHEDDLSGKLLEQQETGGDKWTVISLPAIDNSGAALWPDMFPIERLEQIRNVLPSRDWTALYQQSPTPDDGTFFQKSWFEPRRFKPAEVPKNLNKYITSDHAPAGDTDSDFACVRVWGVDPDGDIYLLDGFRQQITMDVLADKTFGMIRKHKPFCWFPEDDNNWKSSAGFIKRRMMEEKTYCRIEPVSPHGSNKQVKAQAFQAMASMGRVWIPSGSEGDDVIDQYLKFPAGKNDDEVDAAALIGRVLSDAHPAIIPPKEEVKHVDRWDYVFNHASDDGDNWKTA